MLDEATLNAAIAVIASVKPQSELEALIAVQIVATGFYRPQVSEAQPAALG